MVDDALGCQLIAEQFARGCNCTQVGAASRVPQHGQGGAAQPRQHGILLGVGLGVVLALTGHAEGGGQHASVLGCSGGLGPRGACGRALASSHPAMHSRTCWFVQAAAALVSAAYQKGSCDNISVLVVRVRKRQPGDGGGVSGA